MRQGTPIEAKVLRHRDGRTVSPYGGGRHHRHRPPPLQEQARSRVLPPQSVAMRAPYEPPQANAPIDYVAFGALLLALSLFMHCCQN